VLSGVWLYKAKEKRERKTTHQLQYQKLTSCNKTTSSQIVLVDPHHKSSNPLSVSLKNAFFFFIILVL